MGWCFHVTAGCTLAPSNNKVPRGKMRKLQELVVVPGKGKAELLAGEREMRLLLCGLGRKKGLKVEQFRCQEATAQEMPGFSAIRFSNVAEEAEGNL